MGEIFPPSPAAQDIPFDISSNPDRITGIIFGATTMLHRRVAYPISTEKNTTYAHTVSITTADEDTALVKAVTASVFFCDKGILLRSYLYINLPVMPKISEDKISDTNSKIPSREL